jgi:hypothetical protein
MSLLISFGITPKFKIFLENKISSSFIEVEIIVSDNLKVSIT